MHMYTHYAVLKANLIIGDGVNFAETAADNTYDVLIYYYHYY